MEDHLKRHQKGEQQQLTSMAAEASTQSAAESSSNDTDKCKDAPMPTALQGCFNPSHIKWQLFRRFTSGSSEMAQMAWTEVMTCPKPHCQHKLNIKEYVEVHVLDVDHAFKLEAPWLSCPSCMGNAETGGNDKGTYCTASYRDQHLRQLECFLKDGSGVVNIHILHIGGDMCVTLKAFFEISRTAQNSSFASAAPGWTETHLDALRPQFVEAKRASRFLANKEHAMIDRIRELYDKLCDAGCAYHAAVKELNDLLPKAGMLGLVSAVHAALWGAEILKPTPTHDAAYGLADPTTTKCGGRRKLACPSDHMLAHHLKFRHKLQYHELTMIQQRWIRRT
eukprot:jgi/Ulvmu1/1416/UM011_0145.1